MPVQPIQINNARGGTLLGVLIALVLIGILVHPKTSPFKDVYFDYLARGQLKDLHKACKNFWASEITGASGGGDAAGQDFDAALAADVFTSRAKKGTTELSECDIENVTGTPFEFKPRPDVTIELIDGTNEAFEATAKHSMQEKTHRIDQFGKLKG